MKLPDGCGDKSGKVVKLNKSVYSRKQACRRWAMHLGDVIVRKIGMEQCKADPCVFRLIRDGVVVMIVCVHVDDITVAGEFEALDFLSTCLFEEFQTTGGELSWYLGCAFERDRKRGVLRASQRAFIESVVSQYGGVHCLISRLLNQQISALGGMTSRSVINRFVRLLVV